MPEKTAAQKRAQKAYMEKFVRVEIRMDANRRNTIQAHAAAHSESVNSFINRAIDCQIEQDSGGTPPTRPQEALEGPQGAGAISLPPDALKTAREAAEAAGEGVPVFVARAVETQAKRDKVTRRLKA